MTTEDHECLVAEAGAILLDQYGPALVPLIAILSVSPEVHVAMEAVLKELNEKMPHVLANGRTDASTASLLRAVVSSTVAQLLARKLGCIDDLINAMEGIAKDMGVDLRQSKTSVKVDVPAAAQFPMLAAMFTQSIEGGVDIELMEMINDAMNDACAFGPMEKFLGAVVYKNAGKSLDFSDKVERASGFAHMLRFALMRVGDAFEEENKLRKRISELEAHIKAFEGGMDA